MIMDLQSKSPLRHWTMVRSFLLDLSLHHGPPPYWELFPYWGSLLSSPSLALFDIDFLDSKSSHSIQHLIRARAWPHIIIISYLDSISSMALASKIDAAKSQVEALRQTIQIEKARVNDSKEFATLKDLRGIVNQPRIRRILKGHFGKVYAMHWSGNGFVFKY